MNVVSVTLFSDPNEHWVRRPNYLPSWRKYLPVAIRAHHNLYRGWSFRIHHDQSLDSGIYGRVLRALEEQGLVELVPVADPIVLRGRSMLWRLLPLWDNRVERFLCRDIDTVPGFRERCAVEEWIKSGLAFHAISDKCGSHDFPTLGGMVGFHTKQTRVLLKNPASFDEFLDRTGWTEKQWSEEKRASSYTTNNQFFLAEQVWPHVRTNAFEHRLSRSCVFEGTKVSKQEIGLTKIADVQESVRVGADALIPFIGSADVNLDKALAFYKTHGDPKIERAIAACEATQ